MKSLSKPATITSGLITLIIAAFALSPVMADSPGQIEGGPIYRIQNLTQKTDFANPASASACDELEYSVRLHNSGYGSISNINVTMSLPAGISTSNTSTMLATYQKGVVPSTTASATVNLSSAQSISYVNGTTELLDNNGKVIKTLSDGVNQSGVNIGSLNGSTTEYVNFEAKVSCPTPPQPPVTPPVTPPTTTTTTSVTPAAPTQLVNTGAGSIAGVFAFASIAGTLVYRFMLARRLSRQ